MTTAEHNPFRAQALEALPFRAEDFCWERFREKLDAHHGRGLIVGPHGVGKTTLLLSLAERLQAEGQSVRTLLLNEDSTPHAWRNALDGDHLASVVLLIDGIEQMSPIQWWRFRRATRNARTIVGTSHHIGRLPLLLELRPDFERSWGLLEELGNARLTRATFQQLFETHQGDMHQILRALYHSHAANPAALKE